jgi:hypothetical protein
MGPGAPACPAERAVEAQAPSRLGGRLRTLAPISPRSRNLPNLSLATVVSFAALTIGSSEVDTWVIDLDLFSKGDMRRTPPAPQYSYKEQDSRRSRLLFRSQIRLDKLTARAGESV